jgi:hypothetical protein
MSGEVNFRLDQIKKNLDVKKIAKPAYDYFRRVTPIRTGNARANTDLINTSIVADYPYARPLDTGWSKQAPSGMSEPTIRYVQQLIKKEAK